MKNVFRALILGLVALFAFLASRPAWSQPAASASGYVDPALCADCHASTARTYSLTGMARSFSRLNASNKVEDFRGRNTLEHALSGRTYEMIQRGDAFIERRYELGFGGRVENADEKQSDFVIGSGQHARTYLHRTAEGKLIELPVSWYSEKGGYWGMSPGYDRPDPEDFSRLVPYGCLFCHTGYPPASQLSGVRGSDPVFGANLPEGIDCQRCHGPGQAHIEAARSGSATRVIRAAIVNPARLSRERQLEVCTQCHMETTSSTLPAEIRRYDREPFSYRPGQPLADYKLFFNRSPGAQAEDRVEVTHAAYRLFKSECFQKSQMTCTTCHNPHDIPRGEQAAAQYTAVCRSCHRAPHSRAGATVPAIAAGADCLGCHMPKRRTDDAVHVVMTDHYIQRNKPSQDLLVPLDETAKTLKNYRGEVIPYAARAPVTRDSELYLALAQVIEQSNLEKGIARLEQAISRYKPRDPEFYFELGRAFSDTGKKNDAVRCYQESLRISKGFLPAWRELTRILAASGEFERAIETGENGLNALGHPDTTVLTDLGSAYLQAGNVDRAAEVLRQALAIDADQPSAANLLGLTLVRKGDGTGAEAAFREALRVRPALPETHYNLGNLLAAKQNLPEAAFHFEKAIAYRPDYSEAHHSYAILLMLTRSWDRAIAEMQATIRLRPEVAETHKELADLLATAGQPDSAAAEYRRAIELKPDLAEAYYRLGMVLRGAGELADAEQQFRLAIQKAAQSGDKGTADAASDQLRSLTAPKP